MKVLFTLLSVFCLFSAVSARADSVSANDDIQKYDDDSAHIQLVLLNKGTATGTTKSETETPGFKVNLIKLNKKHVKKVATNA